jgi:Glycosyl transferase family 8
MGTQLLTGTNAKMFAQTFILMQSLSESGTTHPLTVCDFGLTGAQRAFLKSRGQLATIPSLPRNRRHHPWYHKAALVEFMTREASTAVWLDADMMVMSDIGPLIDTMVADMNDSGQNVAACQDTPGMDIDNIVRSWLRTERDCERFLQLLRQWNIHPQHAYLNSGFFVVTSRRLLKDWKRVTFESDPYFLFEQSAFNIVAWRAPQKVRVLDAREWNVHGECLPSISFAADSGHALCEGRRSQIVHATSLDERYHEETVERWYAKGVERSDVIKYFRNPKLREMQRGLFDRFVKENERALALAP